MKTISIVIPTYNSQRTINECLKSIKNQTYPKNKIETIIIDGGSKDNTLKIVKKYACRILRNPKVIHPIGRAVGIKQSKNELILCLDSDNILPNDFLSKIVKPFENKNIIASEPLYYLSDRSDNVLNRYCALMGGDDPIAIYLGYYDRFSYLTNNWTGMPVKQYNKKQYIKFKIISDYLPPLGANGFIVRSKCLKQIKYTPFLHVDIVYKLKSKFKSFYFAKSKIGVYHKHSDTLTKFFLKKMRRGKRRLNTKDEKVYFTKFLGYKRLLLFIKLLFIIPIFIDAIIGFIRKRDTAWIIHPIIVYLTVFSYIYSIISNNLSLKNNNQYEKV